MKDIICLLNPPLHYAPAFTINGYAKCSYVIVHLFYGGWPLLKDGLFPKLASTNTFSLRKKCHLHAGQTRLHYSTEPLTPALP